MAEEILFTQEGYDKIVEEHDYLVGRNLDFLQGFYIGMPTIYADDFSEE